MIENDSIIKSALHVVKHVFPKQLVY